MTTLWIIFSCILGVFIVSRLITFMVLRWKLLPKGVLSNGRRVHHFVYGNLLIVGTSFAVIGLGVDASSWLIAVGYGLGLGLVIDEFPHWIGNVKELTRNVPIIPGVIPVLVVSLIVLLGIILFQSIRYI